MKDKALKEELNNMLGISSKPVKKTGTLIQRITSIDDVYEELGRIKPTLDNYLHIPEHKRERALNTQYIDDIAELFNEGWIPDFTNSSQKKYYVWFERRASGWGVLAVGYGSGFSGLGSGFWYKSEEVAKHCANLFLPIYSKILE